VNQEVLGRDHELGALSALAGQLRAGRGGSMVIRGEPGIGKTALLDRIAADGSDVTVLRATGVESEIEIPYAAAHQLCASSLGRLDELPGPQADALGSALGLRAAGTPDRFLVGLGVLTLLSALAERQPVLCLVDDAQWIDQSSLSALSFASRRAASDAIAFVFASRTAQPELAGIPELMVNGLDVPAARRLLASVIPGRLDDRVRDRIVAETRGNPLALLELPHGLAPAELAGGFGLPGPKLLTNRIEDSFLRRIRSLPERTQQLLALAASEPLGDPALLWTAAASLGLTAADAAPAERDGLLRIGDQVVFRHPLVRSAIYKSTPAADRFRDHQALAQATDATADPDRRAWHLAQAARGPDETVAAELERSARRARERGGPAASAAFLRAAAMLTSSPGKRAQLCLTSAEAYHVAGVTWSAREMMDLIEQAQLDDRHRPRYDQMRARIGLKARRNGDAPRLLLAAARNLEPIDARAARDGYLDALMAAFIAGPGALGPLWAELNRAAGSAPEPSGERRSSDDLLDSLAAMVNDGYDAAAPRLRSALAAVEGDGGAGGDGLSVLWLASRAAMNLWDDVRWPALSNRLVATAREQGILGALPSGLSMITSVALLVGDFAMAAALIQESHSFTGPSSAGSGFHGPMALAAWQGQQEVYEAANGTASTLIDPADDGVRAVVSGYTKALLCNGLGRYEEAAAAGRRAAAHADELGYALWALPELVEAASRSGAQDLAVDATAALARTTVPAATHWAKGIEERCRALCAQGEAAETAYRRSIDELALTRFSAQEARSRLLYGEWLRRERRRIDARTALRRAHGMFTSMGAAGFAGRAERELAATGEQSRSRTPHPAAALTPQETQIARLAADGNSNIDIAAQLFISPRTVEYHLHKIFLKLNISSRNQLNKALGAFPRV